MTKNDLRRHHLALRKAMTREAVMIKSKAIGHKIKVLKAVTEAKVVFAYAPFNNEVILPSFEEGGWTLALPQVVGEGEMVFRRIDRKTVYEVSHYGIEEPINGEILVPTKASVILVPGTVFDPTGNRIGYGGGFYDRYLVKHQKGMKIGLCYEHQIATEGIPVEAGDIPMDIIITEKGFYK